MPLGELPRCGRGLPCATQHRAARVRLGEGSGGARAECGSTATGVRIAEGRFGKKDAPFLHCDAPGLAFCPGRSIGPATPWR